MSERVEHCGSLVKCWVQDHELAGSTPSAVSMSKMLYPHCLVLVSIHEGVTV